MAPSDCFFVPKLIADVMIRVMMNVRIIAPPFRMPVTWA